MSHSSMQEAQQESYKSHSSMQDSQQEAHKKNSRPEAYKSHSSCSKKQHRNRRGKKPLLGIDFQLAPGKDVKSSLCCCAEIDDFNSR
eukprot:scaffold264817_cov12-Tisochrysis_lutea.AAC.1